MKHVPLALLVVLALGGCEAERPARVPVVYCSDLFHPHDDPDDHFDLACLYALRELDLLGIVLDQGDRQARAPGRIPVSQMNALTGRDVPCAVGLSARLTGPGDPGSDQPAPHQEGVELILRCLRNARTPVSIVTVGSLRDVAAALNREPELFKEKVARLLVFIGAVNCAKPEWNVMLDPHAFVRVMRSGLPIHWVPCFDGKMFRNDGRASFWRASHEQLFAHASERVMRYFVYALTKQADADPLEFLDREADPADVDAVLSGTRNLWCASVFPFLAGRRVVLRETGWTSVPPTEVREGEETTTPFRFVPIRLSVGADARVTFGEAPGAHEVLRFEVVDRKTYADVMTSVTAHLIGSLDRNGGPGGYSLAR